VSGREKQIRRREGRERQGRGQYLTCRAAMFLLLYFNVGRDVCDKWNY
jgi:hypothetical protein